MSRADQAKDRPTKADWTDVKRILKYLWGVSKYRLLYGAGNSKGVLEVFSDADFADDVRTSRSTSSVAAVYAGSSIAWSSQLHWLVGLPTTAAEFIAASEEAKELLWLEHLLGELSGKVSEVPTLYLDNISAVKLMKN